MHIHTPYNYWLFGYSTILHAACNSQWVTNIFTEHFSNIHQNNVLTELFDYYVARAMWNCCHLGVCSVYAINHAPLCSVTSFEATYVGCMCLAATCRLRFWQNDQDIEIGVGKFPITPARTWTCNLLIMSLDALPLSRPTPLPLFEANMLTKVRFTLEFLMSNSIQQFHHNYCL